MSAKYDFIKELLENKKLQPSQRERILKLAADELGNDGTLEDRIKEIEKIVFKDDSKLLDKRVFLKDELEPDNEVQHEKVEIEKSKIIKYFFPYKLYKFLFEYNQNKILKSTCHDIDSDTIDLINKYCITQQYDFTKHRAKILEAYEIHEKRYFASPKVKGLIRGYLTGKDYHGNELKSGWSSDDIKFHWFHDGLLSWAKENPGIPPNLNEEILGNKEVLGFEFDQINSKISGKTIQNFTELVLHFKHLFHIRNDNSLREIIERVNIRQRWHKTIDFEITDNDFPRNIELFTDVDKLVQAYERLIYLTVKQQNKNSKPKVKLTFFENESSAFLSIHHLNNNYNKSIEGTIKRPIGKSYEALIVKQINGLCNLYLKANFGKEECAEINLWNGKKLTAKNIDHIEGVEHILEFPKTSK